MNEVWKIVAIEEPPAGIEKLGFNEMWVNDEYNPEGTCLCFINDDKDWTIAFWDNRKNEWITANSGETIYGETVLPPTHWTDKTQPPFEYLQTNTN